MSKTSTYPYPSPPTDKCPICHEAENWTLKSDAAEIFERHKMSLISFPSIGLVSLIYKRIGHESCRAEQERQTAEYFERERQKEADEEFIRRLAVASSSWPYNWAESTFDSLVVHDGNRTAITLARAWSPSTAHGLLIQGPSGTGKSHLGWALVNDELDRCRTRLDRSWPIPRYISASQLLADSRRNNFDLPGWVQNEPFIFLDDIGAENATEWSREILFRFFETRIASYGITIVTTNFTLSEIRERLHDRIASRIQELCVPVQVTGTDRRREKMIEAAAALAKAAGIR